MTYRDIERYVMFYNEQEQTLKFEMLKWFRMFNAESVAIGASAVQSKRGSSYLSQYISKVRKQKMKQEPNEEFDIEDQFKELKDVE